ncbi:hypothetical protein PISMIDRAFT_677955 [Pisolithus microcarpus 441]|uniref:Unplaced genomic scaffold scaffold_29, whole genome shotgun sequence n=1 Tax=Pisolithus microcarpus 441 TaxID=765257 RepID=A0A0C9ZYL7_9AGAM|nr:hypothetical protein PISMIDRAFT_677955 [Pisolithus microcarpus 441]
MREHTLNIGPWTIAPCRQTSDAVVTPSSEGPAHGTTTERSHLEGNKPCQCLQRIHRLASADKRRECDWECQPNSDVIVT